MLRVYTASTLHRAQELQNAFSSSSKIFLHARWLKLINLNVEDSAENARNFWVDDISDAISGEKA